MDTLEEQRLSFIRESRGFLAFPLAGAIVWTVIGATSYFLARQQAVLAVVFGTGVIFPVALLVARVTGQQIFQQGNRFASLMGLSVLMVNLLWALHLLLAFRYPALVPLSVALGLGLHWIVFGWIIRSHLGLLHAVLRTVLCTGAFLAFPTNPVLAVCVPVVLCYGITLLQLRRCFPRT